MAKDRKKLIHIHSSIADKQPAPQSLEVGEIAVNNSADKEFLSLKNSNDKVVRFSSDEQLITWMEKKEVMPYEGYTRGSDGPAGATGPDSVTNDDLLQNKSNLIIKLNQVAATNTVKHDKVNGAKDIYGNYVNPTSDSGVTDGAGFAIDMSRYAMIGANPSFSSLTVTDKTDLSGNTTIADGDGTSTRSGNTLTIKTTDVSATDTNWTENITNKTEKITLRDTTIGTEKLYVSGTTIETYEGAVTITNNNNKVETISGINTINNEDNYIVNTSGDTHIITTRNTAIHSNNSLGISANEELLVSSEDNIIITANDEICETAGNKVSFYGVNQTNIGLNCDDNDASTITKINGDTIITSANTANASATTATLSGNTLDITEATRLSAKTPSAYVSGTSLSVVETNTDIESCGRISGKTNAFTIQECAAGSGKTVINQTDIKASGKTLSFDETTSISAKTPSATLSGTDLTVDETTSTINSVNTNLTGTNLTISEDNTVISSCTKVEVNTNDLAFKQCEDSGAVNFEFCGGFNVKSDAVKFEQCGDDGSFTVNEKDTTISGTNLNVNETTTTVNSTNTIVSGTNLNVTETNTNMSSSEATCITAGTTAAFVGATKTNIGKDCSDDGQTTTLNLNGDTINETGGTIVQTSTGDTTVNVGGDLVENVTGSTTENHTGPVTENNAGGLTIATTGKTCIQSTTDVNIGGNSSTNIGVSCDGTVYSDNVKIYAQTSITETADTVNISGASNVNVNGNIVCVNAASKANFYGAETNIGVECGGSTATTVNISGATVNEGGTTNNNDFTTINNNTTTYNITGDTNIDGDAYISGILTIPSGISKKLSWTAGSFTPDSVGYNGSEDKVITVPTAVSHLTRGNLTVTHNGLTDTFDPASDKSMTLPHSALTWSYGSVKGNTGSDSYDTSAEKSITIPTKVQHLDEWDGSCLVLPGCVQASGFYQSSDINLKENIASANFSKQVDANNIAIEQFNYKSDESKRIVYGVIAQDVEQLGLEELVYTNDEGFKSVDYTSLMLLKIAYLENENKRLNHKLDLLTERFDKIENKE